MRKEKEIFKVKCLNCDKVFIPPKSNLSEHCVFCSDACWEYYEENQDNFDLKDYYLDRENGIIDN